MLPSVDLVQDVRQREVPLAPPARSGCYATQHGLLDGADGALCRSRRGLLLDVPEIQQLLELPLELGAVVGVHVGRHPQGLEHLLHARGGGRKTVLQRLRHQHEGVGLAPEGLHVCQVHLQLVHGLQRHEAVVVLVHPEAVQKRLHFLFRDAGVARLSLPQRLRYAAEACAGILVDGLDGSSAGVGAPPRARW